MFISFTSVSFKIVFLGISTLLPDDLTRPNTFRKSLSVSLSRTNALAFHAEFSPFHQICGLWSCHPQVQENHIVPNLGISCSPRIGQLFSSNFYNDILTRLRQNIRSKRPLCPSRPMSLMSIQCDKLVTFCGKNVFSRHM